VPSLAHFNLKHTGCQMPVIVEDFLKSLQKTSFIAAVVGRISAFLQPIKQCGSLAGEPFHR
jgi:hypothetical protein